MTSYGLIGPYLLWTAAALRAPRRPTSTDGPDEQDSVSIEPVRLAVGRLDASYRGEDIEAV